MTIMVLSSDKVKQIVPFLEAGRTPEDVAQILNCSVATIYVHMKKLGVSRSAEGHVIQKISNQDNPVESHRIAPPINDDQQPEKDVEENLDQKILELVKSKMVTGASNKLSLDLVQRYLNAVDSGYLNRKYEDKYRHEVEKYMKWEDYVEMCYEMGWEALQDEIAEQIAHKLTPKELEEMENEIIMKTMKKIMEGK